MFPRSTGSRDKQKVVMAKYLLPQAEMREWRAADVTENAEMQ
jgi:hypothetical protein